VRQRISREKRGALIGAALLCLGLFLPAFVNVKTFRVYELISWAVDSYDSGVLIIAASVLVLLNSLRALPLYVGSFLLCTGLFFKKWMFRVGVLASIYLCYSLTSAIYSIRYDFGIPSVIVIFIIYLLDSFDLFNVSLVKRSVIVIFVLIGVQFLDVVPALSSYGFGRGEVSLDIKIIAQFVDQYNVLTIASLTLMIIFVAIGLLISQLLRDQHKLLRSADELAAARLSALEARKDSEIKNLVHDLKTPLTAIEALTGVCLILADPNEKEHGYLERIASSAETMSEMITQILQTDRTGLFTTEDLFSYSLSQIASQTAKDKITLDNPLPGSSIRVNKILFSRALINLINNALAAVDEQSGRILITVERRGGQLCIRVSDNGQGIEPEALKRVWELGYSGHGSTGLGLGFVKSVINGAGGNIQIDSQAGIGTTATILIEEVFPDDRTSGKNLGG
jgi:signal transduction histidine kinase